MEIKDDDKTLKSKKEVEQKLKSHGSVAILFFMRTCGHCMNTKPIWDNLANESYIKMLNASAENVPDSLGITGFPTMILIENGKVKKRIDGERTDKDELKKELLGSKSGGRRRRTRSRKTRRRTVRKSLK